ncbi:HAMP domain-containing protein [Clostridium sp. MCC353]|uniref:cache domain-containing sensor histidine kinase n=1 Tax=Clostridium sp. MCC353 TaxID=2592646 RepID=UPI001C027811|nr:sensor histidine kinase [Clostridium sp. MCC353]MBT9776846.1 HAMP domain-containing protein [Clostridium sp. MCC353]
MNNKKRFKSIKKRLLLITTFFTLAVALLTSTYCYFSYQTILYDSLKQSTEYSLKLLAETIQYDINNAVALTDFCTSNSTITSYLKASNRQQDNTVSLANHAWKRLQEEYLSNSSSLYLNRIIVSDLTNNYIQISPSVIYQNLPCAELIKEQPFFDTLYDAETHVWTGFIQDPITPFSPNNLVLPIVRPIYSVYGKEVSGWCYLAITPGIFTNRLKSYNLPSDSSLYITLGEKTYIWEDQSLTDAGSLVPSAFTPGQNEAGRFHKLVSYEPPGSGWYISQTISHTALYKQTLIYMSSLLLIISIVISLGLAFTFYIHRTINIPLRRLQKKLRSVSSGDFSPDPNIEWENELGEIGKGVNSMGEDISHLIQSRMEDQEKKYEMEYEILQNQVNPHFLYNTLNSIIWMAAAQGSNGIVEMASSLSLLLKSISKKKANLHTLREELDLLQHYFLIQKYRYGGGLSLETAVEQEDLYDCMVLKFLLQIVVENAIFHGIEPKGSPGMIRIWVRHLNDGNDIVISVTDNGIGMTESQIADALNNEPDSSDLFRKIGINNIQKRIQYAYGSGYGVTIESCPGSSTTVTITLPCQRKEREELV